MRVNWSRRIGAGLSTAAGVVAVVALAGSPAAASPLFDGAGRSRTVAGAVHSAFEDAQVTAQSMGFYGACTIVGTPTIFETLNDPNFGHIFRAHVIATCQR